MRATPAGVTLDAMRGFLALLVLVAHAFESALVLRGAPSAHGATWLEASLGHGGYWVGGFFVLSGFCVHRAIMGMETQDRSFVRRYLLARTTRLYPVYLAALMMMVVLWFFAGTFEPTETGGAGWRLLQQVFMLQGLTGAFHEMKPSWSLTYEAAYYLAWPGLLICLGWRSKRALLVGGAAAVMVAGAGFITWKSVCGGAPDSMLIALVLIAAQFILWLGGAALAQFWEAAHRYATRWLGAAAVGGILVVYLAQAALLVAGAPAWSLVLAGYAALPCWLGLVLGSSRWTGVLRWQAAACWLGLLSYPLYIMHQVILDAAVMAARSLMASAIPLAAATILFCGVVMIVMIVFGVPLENATLRWRTRWLRRQESTPAPCSPLANG